MKDRDPMGCWQLLHMKQCSCQVCPLYSSLRDPAERAVHSVTGGSSTRTHRGHRRLCRINCSPAHPALGLPSPQQCGTAGSWRGDAPGPPHSCKRRAAGTCPQHQHTGCGTDVCCNLHLKMVPEWPSKDTPLPQAISRDAGTPSVIPSLLISTHQKMPRKPSVISSPAHFPRKKGNRQTAAVVITARDPAVLPDKQSAWPTLRSDRGAGEQKFSSLPRCP